MAFLAYLFEIPSLGKSSSSRWRVSVMAALLRFTLAYFVLLWLRTCLDSTWTTQMTSPGSNNTLTDTTQS
jgi:hypothetical protein